MRRNVITSSSFKKRLIEALCSRLFSNFCDSVAYRLTPVMVTFNFRPVLRTYCLQQCSFYTISNNSAKFNDSIRACNCNLILLQTAVFTDPIIMC